MQVVKKYHTAEATCGELLYASNVDRDILRKAQKVVQSHPHKPTLLEILDHGGSLQTSMQIYLKNLVRVWYNTFWTTRRTNHKREYVVMHDGGTVALDWVVNNESDSLRDYANRPIVLFLHGVLGNSQSDYIYFLSKQLLQEGFLPVVLVARGCGDLELTSASYSVSKFADDVFQIIHLLKEHEELGRFSKPPKKIFMAGYSLGAGGLLNYLGQADDHVINEHIEAAVSVCPPWNHESALTNYKSSWLCAIWNYLLNIPVKLTILRHVPTLMKLDPDSFGKFPVWKLYFTLSLHDSDRLLLQTYDHGRVLCEPIEVSQLNGSTKISRVASTNTSAIESQDAKKRQEQIMREVKQQKIYDNNLEQFYADISPINYAHRINKTPTLVLTAKDDPICPHTAVMSGENFGRTLVTVSALPG